MQRAFVLDRKGQPLMPCHPARARKLLRAGRAAVYRAYPFTIILKYRQGGAVQQIEQRVDPGSKTSGFALVLSAAGGDRLVWAANLQHRGHHIKEALDKRRALRRARRSRKTRYRKPRFLNRRKPAEPPPLPVSDRRRAAERSESRADREGSADVCMSEAERYAPKWLPPSLRSRVDNVQHWTRRLIRIVPLTGIAVETARFDTQKLQNPEAGGIEYQRGTLMGYEVREYLLEKWGRTCAYCGAKNVPLEVEHMTPRSRGGSDRVGNLCLACTPCNRDKGAQTAEEYGHSHLRQRASRSLRDAAAVNSTRIEIGRRLKELLPTTFWSGGQTKRNRTGQGYRKEHWTDAACVGVRGEAVFIPEALVPLCITATGRGSRQMCRVDKHGFPRTRAKSQKRVRGFQTGDIVRACVPRGKKAGTHTGRVAVRSSGSGGVRTQRGTVQGVSHRWCRLLHRADGYAYT